MRIAFYAPMKPPDHPVPSGDREMAALVIAALRLAGHAVAVASDLRLYSTDPSPATLEGLVARAEAEADRLAADWRRPGAAADRPELWFTYHSYYKAPDLLGPAVARRLAIPYVVAEASHALKRSHDQWRDWQSRLEQSLAAAAALFCFTAIDRAGLERHLGPDPRLVDLPPFIDPAPFLALPERPEPAAGAPVELVTVAMMRSGVKLDSYRFLAEALALLPALDWRLTVIGGGPDHAEVERAFQALPDGRIVWRGAVAKSDVARLLYPADLYVWPGIGEGFGVAYLEAQASGLPVVALDSGGVSSVLRPGETGLLVESLEPAAYAEAIAALIQDAPRRRAMGRAARAFILAERGLDRAASVLNQRLQRVLAEQGAMGGEID